MDDFLKGMQGEVDNRTAGSEHAFAARALFTLLKLLDQPVHPSRRKDPEFGFAWFHESWPHFPVYLEARRTVINLQGMIRNTTKLPQWAALMELMKEVGREHCGIILRASLGKNLAPLWVLHSAWNLDPVPGNIRLLYRAKSKDRGVIVERLDSFVASVKLSGWTF